MPCLLSAPLIFVFVTSSVYEVMVDMHRLISAIVTEFIFHIGKRPLCAIFRRGVGDAHPANFGCTLPGMKCSNLL